MKICNRCPNIDYCLDDGVCAGETIKRSPSRKLQTQEPNQPMKKTIVDSWSNPGQYSLTKEGELTYPKVYLNGFLLALEHDYTWENSTQQDCDRYLVLRAPLRKDSIVFIQHGPEGPIEVYTHNPSEAS